MGNWDEAVRPILSEEEKREILIKAKDDSSKGTASVVHNPKDCRTKEELWRESKRIEEAIKKKIGGK